MEVKAVIKFGFMPVKTKQLTNGIYNSEIAYEI